MASVLGYFLAFEVGFVLNKRVCEWCPQRGGVSNGVVVVFWVVEVWGNRRHTICDSCYRALRRVVT